MTILIDNYDSFTYNLVHLVALVSGELPLVIRNDEQSWEAIARLFPERIIVSPGPGRPDRPGDFGVSMAAIERATVPVLGICLGHQGIASAFGGTVTRDVPAHGRVSTILHGGDEMFRGIPEDFQAVRYHSLVAAEPLPPQLRKTAWLPDGKVMALRHETRPLWGVQFHPESVLTEYGAQLMRNFHEAPR